MNDSALPATGFSGFWQTHTSRLILIYGAFFLTCSFVLVSLIGWQTTRYLNNRVDAAIIQRADFLATLPRKQLPDAIEFARDLDPRNVASFGLFDAKGGYLAGNFSALPATLPIDGAVHSIPGGIRLMDGATTSHTRGLAVRLGDGATLILAREYTVVTEVRALIRSYYLGAICLIAIPGLIGGYILGLAPQRRLQRIEAAVQPLMRGDLRTRVPVSSRRDELDLLAIIVNRMLDQLERLLSEVKGVSDNIAHDLRTPLTRLRAQLYRLQRDGVTPEQQQRMIERCIGDTDELLDRFRALLRISELEHLQRRTGFREVDPLEVVRRAHELYAPLAEDRGVRFVLDVQNPPKIYADSELLFEAIVNLVSNGIKFSPPGGQVELRVRNATDEMRIEVSDNGPGIPASEREAVLRRFYRSPSSSRRPGFGLGLSIVAAIVKLHGYRLVIGDNPPRGTLMSIHCPFERNSAAA